jgi:SSS family solute:Na+ symporter
MIELVFIDYFILILFLLFCFIIPPFFLKKESSLKEYFQSSGSLNWFVSGTAMVATTFAADTPLAVTELVSKYGISGNWLWWYGSISTLVTVYFFSHLWKRSGVLTDLEFIQIRYDGVGAKILRIFRSIYLGFFMNIIILSWVNLAMLKVTETIFPNYPSKLIMVILFFIAFLYTSLSGLRGISMVDTFQFFFAMLGCIVLSVLVINLPEIGGLEGLKKNLPVEKLNFIPDFKNPNTKDFSIESFLVFIFIVWWSSWYPGSEPGGGGYIAQRMLSTPDSKSSMLSSLYFTVAHYFIRPWPWILVALCSLIFFPELSEDDKGKGFVMVLSKANTTGLTGLVYSVFIAAYFSTIATHLNWGASYLINDLTKPFLIQDKEDRFYLNLSYILQFIMMISATIISFYFIKNISDVWKFLLESSAGVGFVLIFRWFHPRLNAYSELTGFLTPLVYYNILKYLNINSPSIIIFTVLLVIITVILVTIFTKETEFSILENFYYKIKPNGIFWRNWAKKNNLKEVNIEISFYRSFILTIIGILLIFSGLFSIGNILFGSFREVVISLLIFIISISLTILLFPKFDKN